MKTTDEAPASEVVHMAYGHFGGESYQVPLSMCSTFNGVVGWHRLSDEERAQNGWYPARLINSGYDSVTQVRELATCSLIDGVIHAEFKVRDKTRDELLAVQKTFLETLFKSKKQIYPQHAGLLITPELIAALPVQLLQAGVIEVVDWEVAGSWTTLSLEDVLRITLLYQLHIQACFSAKKATEDALKACDDIMSFDINKCFREAYSAINL